MGALSNQEKSLITMFSPLLLYSHALLGRAEIKSANEPGS